jgi:hypothetical protein
MVIEAMIVRQSIVILVRRRKHEYMDTWRGEER